MPNMLLLGYLKMDFKKCGLWWCLLLYFGPVLCFNNFQPGTFLLESRQKFLDTLMSQKMNKVPPNYNTEHPTNVTCELFVENFDSISEATMDFTVTVLLHVSWFDQRFAPYRIENLEEGYIEIDSKNMDKLWVPDLYFPNEKQAYYHNVLMPNKMLRIHEGGHVEYSARLTLTLGCPMDFRSYPFDQQDCKIQVESYSYNEANILLQWASRNGTSSAVHLDDEVSLPQFEIIRIRTSESSRQRRGLESMNRTSSTALYDDITSVMKNEICQDFIELGNHSALQVEFGLARNIKYYLVQMYIPSILVVVLSWISFWLNVNAVPGRISLGVLTVLTMTTQSGGVNSSLPTVSYTKAIDIWMSTCLLFVFLALIEFAVANVLVRKDMNKGFKLSNLFSIPKQTSDKEDDDKTKNTKEVFDKQKEDPENGIVWESTSAKTQLKKKKVRTGVLYAMYCDVGSRILFPALFILFNIVYWSFYLTQLSKERVG